MCSKKDCPPFCPACLFNKKKFEETIEQKQYFISKKLKPWQEKITQIAEVPIESRTGYRRKVCLHAFFEDNKWKFGFLSKKVFLAIPHCNVHDLFVNDVADLLGESLIQKPELSLKFLVISGKQILLVLKRNELPDLSWFNESLKKRLAHIGAEGFWIHLNPSAGHKIYIKNNFHLIYGKAFSSDETGMRYGPMSFQQQIPEIYQVSLHKAFSYLKPDTKSLVVDLYCGNGNSIKHWLSAGASVCGVELNGEAIEHAGYNVPGAKIFRGRCEDRIPQLTEISNNYSFSERLLYVNPPRTGLEPKVTEWIYNIYKPSRIAYLSCSTGTLARDLHILESKGFVIEEIIPYDFFPYTLHIECLVFMRDKSEFNKSSSPL